MVYFMVRLNAASFEYICSPKNKNHIIIYYHHIINMVFFHIKSIVTQTVLLLAKQSFFKMSYFVFCKRKNAIQVWNNMKMSKL